MSQTKLLASMIILGALLVCAVWTLGGIMIKQNADAQATSTPGGGSNMTSGDTAATTTRSTANMTMTADKNITSSINLNNIIGQAISSKINVSLSDAATTAEASVGNNSHAVAAHIDKQNGYLVYNVMIIDPSMNFSKVIVDPGNGQVLLNVQVSKADMMNDEMQRHHNMMSMMMGGEMMTGPMHQGMMGPGMMGPGMMGPGMMGPGMMGPGMMMGGPQ